MEKEYLGIDPGKKGALAILKPNGTIQFTVMPNTLKEIITFIRRFKLTSNNPIAILEQSQSMPKQGISSAFNYGVGYGELRGILSTLKVPFVEVKPSQWKKEILKGKKRESKGKKKDGTTKKKDRKDVSIKMCQSLFPNVCLIPTPRSTKEHDGIAEACLLAEYGRRMNL